MTTTAPPAGARALYLGRKDHKRIGCTAEALVVRNAGGQVLRYPLARVARVVCAAALADWSGEALALCLRHGIGITWTDAQGAPLGVAYPARHRDHSLLNLLELMLEDGGGQARYQNWLRSRRMAVLTHTRQADPEPLDPVGWETLKREWVYGGAYAHRLPERLRGLCMAHVAAQLQRHGLPPLMLGPQAETVRLDDDLCQLLFVQMDMETSASVSDGVGDRETILLFESWINRNGAALLMHLYSLQRCARRAMEP